MSRSSLKRLLLRDSDDFQLLRRILGEHGVAHARSFVAVGLFMAVTAACTAASAYILGSVINTIYAHKQFLLVVVLAVSMIVLFTVRGFATYAQAVFLARISNQVVASTQRRLIDKLLHESIGYFSAVHSSEIVARANHGAAAASRILNLVILTLGRDLLTLVGLIIVMVWQDPFLTVLGFCVMPLAAIGVRELLKRTAKISKRHFSGTAAIMQILQETIQGIRVIKAFNVEDRIRRRIDDEIEAVTLDSNTLARIANRSSPLVEALGGIAVALVLLYSGYRVVEVGDQPGRFFSFMTAFLLAFDPARRIARLNFDLSSSLIAARTIFDLIDAPATEPDDSDLPSIDIREGRVVFSEVDFAYREDTPVLRRVSFVAEPNEMTALVGLSGGGKSTIISLLPRFFEPQSGLITIDGRNIREVSRHSLRAQLAYVGQDVFLFRGTIRDNILIGREDASQADIETAAEAAFAHGFIVAFPRGYDTEVGEFGWQLSLGQRQRIAIARALLKNCRIVLLDEATASLDSESEDAVQQALRHLCAGRTTIVIAHRLTTIRHADCIHVVEEGVIAESGREESLIARKGRYESFFRLQFQAQGEAGTTPEQDRPTPVEGLFQPLLS